MQRSDVCVISFVATHLCCPACHACAFGTGCWPSPGLFFRGADPNLSINTTPCQDHEKYRCVANVLFGGTEFCFAFEEQSERHGCVFMLCRSVAALWPSVGTANINNAHACCSFALIDDFGWNSHEIESVGLLQLKYVSDCARWHWHIWERRALSHRLRR